MKSGGSIMDEAEIKKKVDEFKKRRNWYQSIIIGNARTISDLDLRASIRTDCLLKFIPQLVKPNDRVIDIGCNAGLYSLTAAQICKEVLGVDVSEEFIKQANFVKYIWEQQNKKVSNITFKVSDILKELKLINNFDVIFACKVLYHRKFVAGIHNFMTAVKNSKVRMILAQGHVTQPKYGNIESMTGLFNKYGFDVILLENIPEYPIVLAKRKGVKTDKKIKPITEVHRDIKYYKNYDIKKHRMCAISLKNIYQKNIKFDEYREVFERCFVEVGMMKGTLGYVQPSSIVPSPLENTKFGEIMGINKHTNARVLMAKEFFDLYEKYGRKKFLNKYMYETEYYRSIVKIPKSWKFKFFGLYQKKHILYLLQMYENMKTIKNLVPRSKDKMIRYDIWRPEDFPWAINYFGYIKKRDGSHRRMIMSYFGSKTIDTVVVDFEKLSKKDLENSITYLRNNFEWFYNEVKDKYNQYCNNYENNKNQQ